MDCQACKQKVRKVLKHFPGVENIELDMDEQKVTVKGDVDPWRVYEALKKKCGKRTTLIYPHYTKEEEMKAKEDFIINSVNNIVDSITDLLTPKPPDTTVELKVRMHCGACAKKVKKTLLKVDGVMEVEGEMENDKVVVRGRALNVETLCERVRQSGKACEVVSVKMEQKPQKKDEKEKSGKERKDGKMEKPGKQEEKGEKDGKKEENGKAVGKKEENGEKGGKKEEKGGKAGKKEENGVKGSKDEGKGKKTEETKKEGKSSKQKGQKKGEIKENDKNEGNGAKEDREEKAEGKNKQNKQDEKTGVKDGDVKDDAEGQEEKHEETKPADGSGQERVMEPVIKQFVYMPHPSVSEYAYAPQIFSDENPNACSLM
ncbi:hypothetical protein KP509_32G067500 [Ceratopteris richardii]|nr:hypothetical protein KP509_32G067500 [Ceratopteris richardii]